MAREAKKTAEGEVPKGTEDLVVNMNLEGIKVEGIPKEQMNEVARLVAAEAVKTVKQDYEGRLSTLQESVDGLTTRAEEAEAARDAAKAELEGVKRRMEFDKLFDKHAVPQEDREEMFADFEGVAEDKADKILARFDRRESKGDLEASKIDKEVPVETKKNEVGKQSIEELGRQFGQSLMAKTPKPSAN